MNSITTQQKNANRHTERGMTALERSIQQDGMIGALTVAANGDVFDGSARREVFDALAMDDAIIVHSDGSKPIIHIRDDILSADDPKAVRLGLAANRIAELNLDWDAEVIAEIQATDAALFDGLFDAPEIAEILSTMDDLPIAGDGGDEFDTTPDTGETRCKLGDLWQLGDHRLLVGDSTQADTVARLMDGAHCELCFSSPPYLDARDYGGCNTSVDYLCLFFEAAAPYVNYWAINLGIIRKDKAVIPYWDTYIAAAQRIKNKLLSWNIWDQGENTSIGKITAMFPIAHEFIFVFGQSSKKLNPTTPNKGAGTLQVPSRRQKDGTLNRYAPVTIRPKREMGTVHHLSPHGGYGGIDHPAMFPIGLPSAYIESMTDQGQIIYDPFLGSGTALIACERTKRRCYGLEIDPHYADVILRRWETETGKTAVLVNNEAST